MMGYQEYTVKVYSDITEWRNADGKLHRVDGPAVEWADGHTEYWINGVRHRKDGPAIEWPAGGKEYWIDGVQLSKDEFLKRTQSCDGKVVEIDGQRYKLEAIK